MNAMTGTVYQFKITLKGIRPPVWRRIQVPSTYTFWDLHVAIQDAMGWLDRHFHMFRIWDPGLDEMEEFGVWKEYMPPRERVVWMGLDVPVVDCFTLANRKGEYDPADGWKHAVVLERILPRDRTQTYPICLAGRRASPPESCGGARGYEELLEIIADPSHEEYAEKLAWLDGPFDPEKFDPAAVEFRDPQQQWKEAFEDETNLWWL